MNSNEFSRMIDRRAIGPEAVSIEASLDECAALARRFELVAVDALSAQVQLIAEGAEVAASGTLRAAIVQTCAISGEPLPVAVDEPIAFRFVPQRAFGDNDIEVELEEAELDEIDYAGTTFDLGEAVAQSLALAIDPYATGPEADQVREKIGLSGDPSSGPFAALAALKKDQL